MSTKTKQETEAMCNVALVASLPIGSGSTQQAMPNHDDLFKVRNVSERTVAGYEVLLATYDGVNKQYTKSQERVQVLEAMLRRVVAGNWSVTEVQEVLGDI